MPMWFFLSRFANQYFMNHFMLPISIKVHARYSSISDHTHQYSTALRHSFVMMMIQLKSQCASLVWWCHEKFIQFLTFIRKFKNISSVIQMRVKVHNFLFYLFRLRKTCEAKNIFYSFSIQLKNFFIISKLAQKTHFT